MGKRLQKDHFFLSENSVRLAKKNKKIHALLQKEPLISENVTIYETKVGCLTLKYKDIVLHSMYDPYREAERFIDAQDIQANSKVVVYGFALGYHIEALLGRIGKSGKVFVLEPNIEILKAALTLRDFTHILDDKRLHMITGETEEVIALRFLSIINNELKNAAGEVRNIVIHEASFKCLPQEFTQLQNIFEMLLMERRTPDVFAKKNSENIHANVREVIISPGIHTIEKIFNGKPAFFINAGPSLDNCFEILKKYYDKAVYFCCDTALPALLDQGITPDFVLSVDPQDASAGHFDGYANANTILIFTPTSSARVVNRYHGRKMVIMQKGHSVTHLFEDYLSQKGFTQAGGSVSCIGLDILMYLGCAPLFFVGMDYSFPCGKFYSANVAESKKWVGNAYKLRPLESLHREAIFNNQKVIVQKNRLGNTVFTYQTMYTYLRQIETLVENHPECQFYNVFPSGVSIVGVEDILFEEELALFLKESFSKEIPYQHDVYDEKTEAYILNTIDER